MCDHCVTRAGPVKSHYFPTTYSTPCVTALNQWIEGHYDIAPIHSVSYHYRGMNDTFLVNCLGSRFVLRIYRYGWRSFSEITYELDLLDHLRSKAVAVSYPLKSRSGRRTETIPTPEGDRVVVLFSFAPGREVTASSRDSEAYGKAIGQMHRMSNDFISIDTPRKLDLDYLLTRPLAIIRAYNGVRSS